MLLACIVSYHPFFKNFNNQMKHCQNYEENIKLEMNESIRPQIILTIFTAF